MIDRKAFSLIELLLVVVILGVLAGLALPNFSQTFRKIQLQETAKNIAFLMRYAQGRSITHQKMHLFVFDGQKKKYWILQALSDDQDNNDVRSFKKIAGRNGRVFKIPEEVTIESALSSIQFFPDGEIEEAVIYVHGRRAHTLTISTKAQAGYVMLFDFRLDE